MVCVCSECPRTSTYPSPHPRRPALAHPSPGHPYYWEGQKNVLDVERAVARGLSAASGLHIRNAGAMHVLHGNTVKAPLPGTADYEERLRAMDGLAGFFCYLLLTVA